MRKKKIMILIVALLLAVAVVGALGFFWVGRGKPRTYEEKVAAFVEETPTLKQGQIVFIGDSMTERYKLDRAYKDLDLEVYNRGISGDTATWLQARLGVSLFDLAPSKVVLMIGTNDINYGRSAEEIAGDYESILHLMRQNLPDAKIWCVSIVPQNTDYSEGAAQNNAQIREANEKIKALACSYGLEYVDLYSLLVDENGLLNSKYSSDGLHLNNKGYAVWTNALKERLQ